MAINNGTLWPRNGFTPVRRDNTSEQYVRRYLASAPTNLPIAPGMAVTIVGGIVVPCTAGQDPDQPGFGVVMGCFTTAGRPFTQMTPKYIASATQGLVDVLYDPNAEYIVRIDASVGQSNIGGNLTLTGASANPNLPRIIQSVTIPTSSSINDLFKLVRMAEQEDLQGAGQGGFSTIGGTGTPVVVRWNRHVWKAGTAGQ